MGWIAISAVKDLIENGEQQKIVINTKDRIIALGSPQRCFTAAQRRTIQLRDGACIIPGCTIPAGTIPAGTIPAGTIPAGMTEIHHVTPDAHGGHRTSTGIALAYRVP